METFCDIISNASKLFKHYYINCQLQLSMKFILILLSLFVVHCCFGQFAYIKDTDGYVNVRDSSGRQGKVVDTLHNGHWVYALDTDGEQWVAIDYEKKGETHGGYVHISRLQFIKNYNRIAAIKTLRTSLLFKWETNYLSISKIPFDYKKHELKYAKNDSLNPTGNFLIGIDGHAIWGTDGNMPNFQYGKIELKMEEKTIELPMKGLYDPNLDFTELNYDATSNTLYISATNSDGAGGYAVLWVVRNGTLIKQWVTIPF